MTVKWRLHATSHRPIIDAWWVEGTRLRTLAMMRITLAVALPGEAALSSRILHLSSTVIYGNGDLGHHLTTLRLVWAFLSWLLSRMRLRRYAGFLCYS